MSGTMKQYIDGLNKIRFDMTTSSIETQTYVVDGKMTSCTKLSGAWNCVTAESTKPDTSATISNDIKTNSADYTITTMPDRTIAGASASCFKVVSKDSTVNYCYSSDAVPLYVKTEGLANGKTVTTEMTATAYSKTVSADVFVPPKSEATTDYSDLMKKYAVPS
jgi:hypothetical protein